MTVANVLIQSPDVVKAENIPNLGAGSLVYNTSGIWAVDVSANPNLPPSQVITLQPGGSLVHSTKENLYASLHAGVSYPSGATAVVVALPAGSAYTNPPTFSGTRLFLNQQVSMAGGVYADTVLPTLPAIYHTLIVCAYTSGFSTPLHIRIYDRLYPGDIAKGNIMTYVEETVTGTIGPPPEPSTFWIPLTPLGPADGMLSMNVQINFGVPIGSDTLTISAWVDQDVLHAP